MSRGGDHEQHVKAGTQGGKMIKEYLRLGRVLFVFLERHGRDPLPPALLGMIDAPETVLPKRSKIINPPSQRVAQPAVALGPEFGQQPSVEPEI